MTSNWDTTGSRGLFVVVFFHRPRSGADNGWSVARQGRQTAIEGRTDPRCGSPRWLCGFQKFESQVVDRGQSTVPPAGCRGTGVFLLVAISDIVPTYLCKDGNCRQM